MLKKLYMPLWGKREPIPEIEWHISSKEMIDTVYSLFNEKHPDITREEFDKLSEPDIIELLGISTHESDEMNNKLTTCIFQRYFPVITEEKSKDIKDKAIPFLEEFLVAE